MLTQFPDKIVALRIHEGQRLIVVVSIRQKSNALDFRVGFEEDVAVQHSLVLQFEIRPCDAPNKVEVVEDRDSIHLSERFEISP